LLQSEKKSLVRFLVIYMTSTMVLFSIASWIFYTSSKQNIIEKQQQSLKYEASHLFSTLRQLHQSNAQVLYYPNTKDYKSAIYDLNHRYIFGNFKTPINYDTNSSNKMLIYKQKVEPYYLGTAYMLLSQPLNQKAIYELQQKVVLMMVTALMFFSILGYFLGRLFVAPMRESIEKMNQFIQDTTHELNTPISTILTNIEMIETFHPEINYTDEFKRIEIASKTLSLIYDDLSYLKLNHNYHREIVNVDIEELLKQRVIYFESIAKTKEVDIELVIKESVTLKIDRNDAIRVIDNLLSNAIKYNKIKGSIIIVLDKDYLSIKDSGIGIKKDDLNFIQQRFQRANSSEGGFGVGLDIVGQVVSYYNFKLDIISTYNQGSQFTIRWDI